MTIFGPDISSFEGGVDVAALPDPFVLAKCTEGTYYADAFYDGWRRQVAATGKLFVPYHFISAQDPGAQAAWMASHIGDLSLPVMIDWEPEGSFKPTFPQLLALADAMVRHGLRPRLAYAPRWHWSQVGSPDLSPLSARGIGLVASSYPGGTAYPGDGASGWQPYGGVAPVLWQFTDAETDHGQYVGDYNAYRGTVRQLADMLGPPAPTTPTGGDHMGTISPAIGQTWPEIAQGFPANGSFDNDTALIWADAGARAAALYARQARDAVNALAARVGAQPPVPVVDVNALAAQIVSAIQAHLTLDVDAQAVAVAVQAQLAQALGGHAAG